jgi:gluconate 2-dehydrogenase gamma chain
MDRRTAVRILSSAAAFPLAEGLFPREALAAAREIHRALAARPSTAFAYLTPAQARAVTALSELIIPRTETPGAIDAGVPAFIDTIVGEWYTDADRQRFERGLADVDRRATETFGRVFADGTIEQQTALARVLDDEVTALRAQRKSGDRSAAPDRHIFATMKGLTVSGYYSSQLGYTRDRKEQLIPGRFIGCAVVPAS